MTDEFSVSGKRRYVRALPRSGPDGSVTLRFVLPRAIYQMVKAFALQMELRDDQALRFVLTRIATMIEDGDVEFLGPELSRAAKKARVDNFGALGDGPKIDLSKLHRSDKTKSGYTGVYANGSGFRAMGRTKNDATPIYLGQFETSEAAAWHRYLHYKREGIPYGELEIEIQKYRTEFHDTRPEEDIIKDIREESQRLGYFHVIFPDEARTP